MASHDLDDLLPRFDQRGMDLGLERMQRAMDELALPSRPRPAIQVAGTNGKGSICSFIGAALQGTRFKVGITTSPHLVSWCERIRVNADLIELPCLRQRLIDQADLHRRHRLTPFEQLLMVAFSHFEQANVDLLVLEVGLGGRLDATTAYPTRPVIAFGNIGLDHREHLGPTLEAIAQEKAAVISSGATVISAAQHPAVAAILETRCREQHAQLHWVSPLPSDWTLGLAGGWQRSNAAVALGALQALTPLGFSVPDEAIRLGFEQVSWPGRLQRARWNGMCLRLMGPTTHPQPSNSRCTSTAMTTKPVSAGSWRFSPISRPLRCSITCSLTVIKPGSFPFPGIAAGPGTLCWKNVPTGRNSCTMPHVPKQHWKPSPGARAGQIPSQ